MFDVTLTSAISDEKLVNNLRNAGPRTRTGPGLDKFINKQRLLSSGSDKFRFLAHDSRGRSARPWRFMGDVQRCRHSPISGHFTRTRR